MTRLEKLTRLRGLAIRKPSKGSRRVSRPAPYGVVVVRSTDNPKISDSKARVFIDAIWCKAPSSRLMSGGMVPYAAVETESPEEFADVIRRSPKQGFGESWEATPVSLSDDSSADRQFNSMIQRLERCKASARLELNRLRKKTRRNRQRIESVVVGDTVYPLRSALRMSERALSAGFEIHVEQLSPLFIGRGSTVETARADWREQVHIAFQELYGKLHFEMTSDQQAAWSVLEKTIDVEGYETRRPLVLSQIGRLLSTRPDPYRIEWFNARIEVVLLADMPAEFVRFKPGQWFEATVERDLATDRLRKVLSIRPRQPLNPMSEQELAEFIARLPKCEGSPKPVKDWTTR